ncbi:MAG: DNA polymerase III subunit delta' [Salinarimonadaceae bacterium]|nr:MAG: DNA polymerase III subunit delta' [Salinarimonadaceae bacterium]
MSDLSQPDRLAGAPHPRECREFIGQEEAEQAFLDAIGSGRLHHAWLLGGMQGVGKATLAYRIARFLLAEGAGQGADARRPASLDVPADHPATRLVAAMSHPGLFVLRRQPATEKKAASTTIPVDQVRRAIDMFSTTAGTYRICIVDSAEDLAKEGANALLKVIEDPPPRSLFLIVAHEPRRVMPTIRSRCRQLALKPLEESSIMRILRMNKGEGLDADVAAAAVARADGSARRAFELLDAGKIAVLETTEALLSVLPREDLPRTLALAEKLSRKDAEEEYELVLDAVQRWVSGVIRRQAGEGAARLAPLVEVCEKFARSAREADQFNLDRRPVILTMFRDLAGAARTLGPV